MNLIDLNHYSPLAFRDIWEGGVVVSFKFRKLKIQENHCNKMSRETFIVHLMYLKTSCIYNSAEQQIALFLHAFTVYIITIN
jgi:hypothetical protein